MVSQYQVNKQSPVNNDHKKTTVYGVGNPNPDLEIEAQEYVGVNYLNRN